MQKGELKHKRSYYCTDSKYRLISDYAALQGRTASAQVLVSVLAEINRHAPKKGLQELVEKIIQDRLKVLLPTRGISSQGNKKDVSEANMRE